MVRHGWSQPSFAGAASGGARKRARSCARSLVVRRDKPLAAGVSLPERLWSVRPAPTLDEQEMVSFRGAVLISVQGRRPRNAASPGDGPNLPDDPHAAAEAVVAASATDAVDGMTPAQLSPELAAALAEPKTRPNRLVFRFLAEQSVLSLVVLGLGLIVASAGSFIEEALLPGLVAVRRELGPIEQRGLAVAAVLAFTGLSLCVELKIKGALIRLGRRLEARFRAAFLDKIPRLNDRYFASRTLADMAERGHAIHEVRGLPLLAGRFLGAAVALGITAGALTWVNPANAPLTLLAAGLAIALPLLFSSLLSDLDYRARTYAAALLGFYFEALRGLVVVRAHGTERVMKREHEGLLVEWRGPAKVLSAGAWRFRDCREFSVSASPPAYCFAMPAKRRTPRACSCSPTGL